MAYVRRTTTMRGLPHVNVKDFSVEISVWGEPHGDHHSIVLNLSVDEAKDAMRQMQHCIDILEAPKHGE